MPCCGDECGLQNLPCFHGSQCAPVVFSICSERGNGQADLCEVSALTLMLFGQLQIGLQSP